MKLEKHNEKTTCDSFLIWLEESDQAIRICAWICHCDKEHPDALELKSVTNFRVWNAYRDQLRSDNHWLRTFFVIASRERVNMKRRISRDQRLVERLGLVQHSGNVMDDVLYDEASELLFDVIESEPTEQQLVIWHLLTVEPGHLGEKLQNSKDAARKKLARAKRRLIHRLRMRGLDLP